MQKTTRQKMTGLFLTLIITTVLLGTQIQKLLTIPSHQFLSVGDPLELNLLLPKQVLNNLEINIHSKDFGKMHLKGNAAVNTVMNQSSPVFSTPGEFKMEFKLFGLIPLRQMVVNVVPPINVVPGGQSIGVLLHSQGVIVVGKSSIVDSRGKKSNPAEDAGIIVGDIIQKINGKPVKTDSQMRDQIESLGKKGQKIVLEIKRQKHVFKTTIKPIYCQETKRYRIGLFIRDSAAGVGTLTFYEPKSKKYGALGHVITDIDTAQEIDLADGKIIGASIEDIRPGKKGQPGEKIGIFKGDSELIGNITQNTQFGIFGHLQKKINNPIYNKTLPIALSGQVHEGSAQILTVLDGNKIESFDIKIEQVTPQSRPEGKGLVIKVTDKRLLEKTGGIVQGMSGSPIIQNNKFVGAVTHVFVNDPTKGFGVLAEWMLMEAGLIPDTVNNSTNLKVG
ncbi:SpoIVB peptidase [Desulfolucanica intricata]|uniref:SpoIVB peptidase n=1 Tax=Desulfolucanica intricata TaxID=1285191 RepID=UPI000B1F75F7|nr:SpoIVB peptidase [Desulfolucanica intricata]